MSGGYVLAEQFKSHTIYFARLGLVGLSVEMTSRIGDARTWPTRGGARLAKRKYHLHKAKIVKVTR